MSFPVFLCLSVFLVSLSVNFSSTLVKEIYAGYCFRSQVNFYATVKTNISQLKWIFFFLPLACLAT